MRVPRRQQLKIQYVNYYGTLFLYIIAMLQFLGLNGVKERLGEEVLLSYQTGAMPVLCAMVFMRARWVRMDLFSGLYVLLEGGVTGLVLFCGYFWLAVRKLDMNSKLHRVVLMANMSILVNGLVESVNNKMAVCLSHWLITAPITDCLRGTTCGKKRHKDQQKESFRTGMSVSGKGCKA